MMNPLHVEIVQTLVPVANEVFDEIRLEVRGEEVVDPKIELPINNNDSEQSEFMRKLTKVCDVAYIMFLLLFLLAFLGGFIMLLVWMSSPNIFGGQQF
uniref:Uncharacterized protein n=1 Tax=viral metagenome TaxID=1070528 RepID=A0A6C0DXT8_9ZZZZ